MGDIWKMLIDEGMQWVQPTRESPYGRETAFLVFDCSLPSEQIFRFRLTQTARMYNT
jgi:hypothetical protein